MEENTTVNVNETTENTQAEETAKTYTAEQVNELLQREADRRVNQALAKQKKEYEKKLSLSSLDEQQRKDAEAQMKIEELQAQLAEFQIEKNKSELKSVLGSRGLDVRFADIINITDDLEESQQNIEMLDKIFKECVRKEVEKRLAGSAPKGNGGATATGELSEKDAKKLSLSEMMELRKNNPELYNKYFN